MHTMSGLCLSNSLLIKAISVPVSNLKANPNIARVLPLQPKQSATVHSLLCQQYGLAHESGNLPSLPYEMV